MDVSLSHDGKAHMCPKESLVCDLQASCWCQQGFGSSAPHCPILSVSLNKLEAQRWTHLVSRPLQHPFVQADCFVQRKGRCFCSPVTGHPPAAAHHETLEGARANLSGRPGHSLGKMHLSIKAKSKGPTSHEEHSKHGEEFTVMKTTGFCLLMLLSGVNSPFVQKLDKPPVLPSGCVRAIGRNLESAFAWGNDCSKLSKSFSILELEHS